MKYEDYIAKKEALENPPRTRLQDWWNRKPTLLAKIWTVLVILWLLAHIMEV